MLAKSSRLSRNSNSRPYNEQTERLLTSIFQVVSILDNFWWWIDVTLVYGIDVVLVYVWPMVVAYGSSKIASYFSDMFESSYVAEVSPVHKINFSDEFNSSPMIKRSLGLSGYTGCLKKSKSNGISNLLSSVFLIPFSWVVTVSAVPSAFFESAKLRVLRAFATTRLTHN